MLKTLLLNANGTPISFISERKVFKLLCKDKVELLATWDAEIRWGHNKRAFHPAIVQLKHQAPWIPRKRRFSRYGVFKRDRYTCQYCLIQLPMAKLTWDHVVPRTQGGESSWKNCVTACFECNNKKGPRTPEQARMKLFKDPRVVYNSVADDFDLIKLKHQDWAYYLKLDY